MSRAEKDALLKELSEAESELRLRNEKLQALYLSCSQFENDISGGSGSMDIIDIKFKETYKLKNRDKLSQIKTLISECEADVQRAMNRVKEIREELTLL